MAGRIHFMPPQTGEVPEIDRVPGVPHPREMLSLLGQEDAEQAFLDLYNGKKLHHAFLLVGPEGIGKATFAYRAARFLLAEAEREGGDALFGGSPDSLAVAETSRTAHLVANDAHPDLGVLKRRYDPKTKKFRSEISVEDTRDSLNLFEKTSAFGGWRVIIVDAADDLNNASANALLKTLEEPPSRAIFLLVTHQPQRLLPTIRSRCRTLSFSMLAPTVLKELVPAISNAAALDDTAAMRANGSVKRALRLGQSGFRAFLALVDDVLAALPKRRHAEIDRIAEACRTGTDGEQALTDFLEILESWLHEAIRMRAGTGDVLRASALAEFWSRMSENAARLDALNLDRRAFVMTLVDELATLVSDAQR
ncbi:MAG: hypothetical protein CFE31_00715 [Rhizobiales bacterium PAR1]|nr:MAG: hypothetical protein CFE31_00715 [Rhizobiales bacterium PAR1]